MDKAKRIELAQQALAGYTSGPDATSRATAKALTKVADAQVVILVEGISDQIALETLAARQDRDLEAEGVLVLPMGGAHAIGRYLLQLGPEGIGINLAGLCDTAEEPIFRRAIANANLGSPQSRADLEHLGFFVCEDDLESELIRAVGPKLVEEIFDSQGDLGSFRTLQKQSVWRDKSVEAQMRRFLGSGARRKLRYARLLVESVSLESLPYPLDALLRYV